MNKKNVVIKKNIEKIADFLQKSIEWLKKEDAGCCCYTLTEDLALYIGWSSGWDPEDDSVIHSKTEPEWAIDAAVKIRNDFDDADFEYLNFPWNKDSGECWDNAVAPSPKYTRHNFRNDARWFLTNLVEMTNAYNRGELLFE